MLEIKVERWQTDAAWLVCLGMEDGYIIIYWRTFLPPTWTVRVA